MIETQQKLNEKKDPIEPKLAAKMANKWLEIVEEQNRPIIEQTTLDTLIEEEAIAYLKQLKKTPYSNDDQLIEIQQDFIAFINSTNDFTEI